MTDEELRWLEAEEQRLSRLETEARIAHDKALKAWHAVWARLDDEKQRRRHVAEYLAAKEKAS